MDILNYRHINKGCVVGVFDLKIEDTDIPGFTLRDCTHFKKNNSEWVSTPSRQYDKDGEKKYFEFGFFPEATQKQEFQRKALNLIKKSCVVEEPSVHFQQKQNAFIAEEELPF